MTNSTPPTLDEKLDEELDTFAETYYPEHEYNDVHRDENTKQRQELIDQIKQAFRDADWRETHRFPSGSVELMTGQEWGNKLNKLDPPVWKHDDGKAYYMFEVDKLDNLLNRKASNQEGGSGEQPATDALDLATLTRVADLWNQDDSGSFARELNALIEEAETHAA